MKGEHRWTGGPRMQRPGVASGREERTRTNAANSGGTAEIAPLFRTLNPSVQGSTPRPLTTSLSKSIAMTVEESLRAVDELSREHQLRLLDEIEAFLTPEWRPGFDKPLVQAAAGNSQVFASGVDLPLSRTRPGPGTARRSSPLVSFAVAIPLPVVLDGIHVVEALDVVPVRVVRVDSDVAA